MSRQEDQASAGRSGQSGQTGTGGQAGDLRQGGGEAPGTGTASATGATVAAVPVWYCRPLFWSGFLLAAILALLGWLVWQAWQTAEAERLAMEKRLAQARELNLAREDFIQQLKLLLQADPCDLPAEMARLTPPPGIIWPPLGSDRLPEATNPDPAPARQAPPNPARTSPEQGKSNDQPDQHPGAMQTDGTDKGPNSGKPGLASQQTGGPDDPEADKTEAGRQGENSFDFGPQKPENQARPDRSDSPASQVRGMQI